MKLSLLISSIVLMILLPILVTFPLLAFGSSTKEIDAIDYKNIAIRMQTLTPGIKQQMMAYFKNLSFSSYNTSHETSKEPTDTTFNIFPIETPLMSPGIVEPRKVNLSLLPQPIFIIGSDQFSKHWLSQHVERLKQLKAIGFLVQAQNSHDFKIIKDMAEELTIIPLSGNSIAAQLGIYHYPVLISQDTVVQ